MATATLLTLEQFSALPEYDERTGSSHELDHGELIIVSPQAWKHESLKRKIFLLLTTYFQERALPNYAVMETGFILDEDSWRKPDVAVMSEKALQTRGAGPRTPARRRPRTGNRNRLTVGYIVHDRSKGGSFPRGRIENSLGVLSGIAASSHTQSGTKNRQARPRSLSRRARNPARFSRRDQPDFRVEKLKAPELPAAQLPFEAQRRA